MSQVIMETLTPCYNNNIVLQHGHAKESQSRHDGMFCPEITNSKFKQFKMGSKNEGVTKS